MLGIIIILGVIMFMLLVLGHELGHFIAAKKSGVKVLEFGIGIPPKLFKIRTDKTGTEYTINLLPLGGFVRLKGEDPKVEEDFKAKDSFIMAKLWKKIIILLAGVGANFIIARGIFTIVFTLGTKPYTLIGENISKSPINSYLMPTKTFLYNKGYIPEDMKSRMENSPVKINEVTSGTLGYKMGIQIGDIIKSINNQTVNAWNIESALKNTIGENITLYYSRNGISHEAKGECPDESCILGIKFSYSGFVASDFDKFSGDLIKFPLGEAMLVSLKEINAETRLTFYTLGNLGKNLISFNKTKISGSINKLSGPVGIVKVVVNLVKEGEWKLFLALAGMISLALAIFNVLPIPALDGGRLLGVLIQGIARFKPEKYFTIENYFNLIFFVILMGLGVYIIFKDLVQFWGINIPFMS